MLLMDPEVEEAGFVWVGETEGRWEMRAGRGG